jgi:hypothetical protein
MHRSCSWGHSPPFSILSSCYLVMALTSLILDIWIRLGTFRPSCSSWHGSIKSFAGSTALVGTIEEHVHFATFVWSLRIMVRCGRLNSPLACLAWEQLHAYRHIALISTLRHTKYAPSSQFTICTLAAESVCTTLGLSSARAQSPGYFHFTPVLPALV